MKITRSVFLGLHFVLASVVKAEQFAFNVQAQNSGLNHAITPAFSAFVDDFLAQNGVQGLSLGVVYLNGSTEYGTWGNRTEDGDKVSQETLFAIGSCSKAFLSAAMGILIDDFKKGLNATPLPPGVPSLTWGTKVHSLLPGESEWKLADSYASEHASINDVLSHLSGLASHNLIIARDESTLDVVRKLRHIKPSYELREKTLYTNLMYITVSHIITKYSGMPFTTFVKKRIFEPLNMNTTTFFASEAEDTGLFSQSFGDSGRRIPYVLSREADARTLAGAGGILSSTVDMTKWLAMLLNDGVNPQTKQKIVPSAALEAVTAAYSVFTSKAPSKDFSLSGYGMGWLRMSYKGHEVITHSGGLPGFLSIVMYFPWDGFGLVAFVNNGEAATPSPVAYRAVDAILGLDSSQSGSATPTDQFAGPFVSSFLPDPPNVEPTTEPSLPVRAYEGAYNNRAYDAFILCSRVSSSHHCNRVLNDFLKVFPRLSSFDLVVEWPRAWASHALFSRRVGNRFVVTPMTLFPEGYGRHKAPFKQGLYSSFAGEFVVRNGTVVGLALAEAFEDLPDLTTGGDPGKEADVYFDRV